jgi:H+-transporting ATPase
MTSAAAAAWERTHGYNEIAEKREGLAKKILRRSLSPISGMLLLAAALSYISGKSFDGSFILVLLVINIGVTVWQERKADTAIEKLNEHLATSVKALRDGKWTPLASRFLVPGDVVELKAGNVIPADAKALAANSASANEAALTGESLPKEKRPGDALYSGSFVASGLITAEVTAIGNATSFGKTFAKAGEGRKKSALERDILRITRFLSGLSIFAIAILSAALFLSRTGWLEILRLDLSLVIAGIPISLPTVMTLIIALGVVELAKKGAIVRRLASLEELANTDLLLTDKTGTLTKNKIAISEVIAYGAPESEVRRLGALVAAQDPDNMLNLALRAGAGAPASGVRAYHPADSSRKRATLTLAEGGRVRTLSLGAPQVIEALCALAADERARFAGDVARLAEHGYRTLALASAEGAEEAAMTLAGIFALSDELREDAAEVIRFLHDNGIAVAMVTGDNRAIAREIARKLSLTGRVMTHEELGAAGIATLDASTFVDTAAFAEVLPEDKLALIERARRFYTVAANGDGINDLPAVKAASVGFAVSNAVDALKGAADIVLLSSGIGVMKDAFIEGRKIFERLYVYSLYRISESFRLILTVVVLGLAVGAYPLTPLELILLALLNDIPIISLATDRVKVAGRPAHIDVKRQFTQGLLYGAVGVANSIALFFFATSYLHLPLPVVETLFFLKLTVSGHLLIYVAHTKERWWRYLPSAPVIAATAATQAIATALALTGFLMPAPISAPLALFVWIWSFFFMQLGEAAKLSPTRVQARRPSLGFASGARL